MQVQTPTLEENFVFGSPPLLNSFTYNTCRSQEGSAITSSTQQQERYLAEDPLTSDSSSQNIMSYCHPKFPNNTNNRQQYSGFPLKNGGSMLESLNQLYLNSNGKSYQQQQQTDSGRKILEQANFNKHHYHQQQHYQQHQFNNNNNNNINMKSELVFKKRKDLRVLKAVLSTERFRKVTMMFGDGDEGGREIVDSVHKAMRSSNTGAVSCLFCNNDSQVYENFPIVDGTLFLSPVKLSKTCIRFDDQQNSSNGLESSTTRHMCFICVSCLEGKPKKLECSSCLAPWNGSFFQVGTLYSYNILSAIPCCEWKVNCKNCAKPIIDWKNGDASTLFFSHFSSKVVCPHCNVDDYHYIKSLDTLRKSCF